MAGASRLLTGPELTRIAPGTYVPAQEWKEARPDLRHLTLIRAALAKTRGDLVLLGASAAVWLGLPLVKTHRAGHSSRSPTEIPLGYAKNARLGVWATRGREHSTPNGSTGTKFPRPHGGANG